MPTCVLWLLLFFQLADEFLKQHNSKYQTKTLLDDPISLTLYLKRPVNMETTGSVCAPSCQNFDLSPLDYLKNAGIIDRGQIRSHLPQSQ